MFTEKFNDDMWTGICIDIDLWSFLFKDDIYPNNTTCFQLCATSCWTVRPVRSMTAYCTAKPAMEGSLDPR